MTDQRIRIAFIKYGGLSAGGTERWLQMMAANLPKEVFSIDYYYCDASPYIGSDYRHPDTDESRRAYMQEHQINLVPFHVGAKDITRPTHDWINTDFWDIFESSRYDAVQTAKAGPAEYPYYLLDLPVVEYVTLSAGVDLSPNIAFTLHLSQWQRARWFRAGGGLDRSGVIPIPAEPPATLLEFRNELSIPADALVAGFHQRVDNHIYSPIPLAAFSMIQRADRHFVIMGGGSAYREQARELALTNVHFVDHSGDAKDISTFLNTLDVFAHGRSDGETFGTVFAEAMMHGLPCLSHSSSIANGHVETMGPAGLFASGVDDYATKLNALFSNEKLRKRLAAKAISHAKEYYSLESCVDQLVESYARVLKKSKPEFHVHDNALIPYGWSDMGLLYAAELDTPGSLGYHVMTGGIPEEFCLHMTRFFLPDVNVFVDVGANTGLYCWVAAKECLANAAVLAFEPQESCCRYLRKTVELNNWEGRVHVIQAGLGATKGKLELSNSVTGSTFDNAFNGNATPPTVTVPMETLDEQLAAHKLFGLDFLKIDAEGFELEVLKGAAKVVAAHRPILFIELADRITGREFRNPYFGETLEWIKAQGYRVWRADETAQKMMEMMSVKPQLHIAMYLCLHEDKHDHLVQGMMAHAARFRARKKQEKWQVWRLRLKRLIFRPVGTSQLIARRIKRKLVGTVT